MGKNPQMVWSAFALSRGLKLTRQREELLNLVCATDKHLSVDDVYALAQKKNPRIGHTTVFRTMKLFSEAGIVKQVDIDHNTIKYEFICGNQHHDHLICTRCGKFIEAMDPAIEALQEKLCQKFNFTSEYHRMEIFGVCVKCK